MICHGRQPSEDIAEVGVGVDAMKAAVFNDGVKDGRALAGSGCAKEHPILFAQGGRADRVFYEVIPLAGLCREEGVDGTQAIVAAAGAVAPVVLKMIEERAYQFGVQVLNVQIAGLAVMVFASKSKQ